ncbi:hypothetical protein [Paenibacillus pinihumi]|uniref:hypothetical protein n=1 Tax=Paenibacillus pinihumi TaxID=669462 RepID=UPI000412242B|nr:hypothetical protein [Paenibacillus pinihumi]
MHLHYKLMTIRACFLPFIIYYAIFMSRILFYKLPFTTGNILLAILPLPVLAALAVVVYYKWLKRVAKFHIVSFVALGIIFCLATLSAMGYNLSNTKFDYNKWVESPNLRIDIVDHMLTKYDLDSRSKDGVIDLLGLPDDPATTQEVGDASLFVYLLGVKKIEKNDKTYYLNIQFNQDNLVERYFITDFAGIPVPQNDK